MPATKLNFVLLVGEDTGQYLGCYGDAHAITPNIDRLAAEGARYTRAYSHAPVCSPSRGGLVTGKYPTAVGFHHHRSFMPKPTRLVTQDLREAGYHVSWPGKMDFNFDAAPESFTDHEPWFEKLPPEPFFVYSNLFQTHESKMREPDPVFFKETARLTPQQRHDPAKVDVPPYLPDTPGVRQEIARHHDNATAIDYQVGDVLALLERSGVADRTVVIFLADHGRGLPREKRWVYERGIHEPLIIRAPGLIKPGTVVDDLIGWVDVAPTILALAGIPIRADLHGQSFLGAAAPPPRDYVFAARDRLDETVDRVRAVRSREYKYIRNCMPERPHMQTNKYMEELATTKDMRANFAAGNATPAQSTMFEPHKPAEELYDPQKDPWELTNLAGDPSMSTVLEEHRHALDDWTRRYGDLGEIDEHTLEARGLLGHRPPKKSKAT